MFKHRTSRPQEELDLITAISERDSDAIATYRADPHYEGQIPEDAEASLSKILNKNTHIFRSKLTGCPACNIAPIRIPLKEGVRAVQSRARRYRPQKQTFLADTCESLQTEGLVRPVHSSEWVAAPLLVPKPPPAMYRMTVDFQVS